jgi:hypothetical protein
MEVQLLKEMIDDREQRIAVVKRKTDEQAEKEKRLRDELNEVHAKNNSQKDANRTEKTNLLQQKQSVETKLSDMSRDLQQQGASLKTYAGTIQQDQSSADAASVMRMQAQLCKAMHSMGIIDHQVELARQHAETILKYQKDSVATMTEEKSQVELKLMNDLMNIDLERRDVEKDLTAKLAEIRKEIDRTERQIEESRDSDEEEESKTEEGDEEEDEEEKEEKEMKEELLRLLQEKKVEIEKIEQATEQQAETIEELEAEVAEIKENGSSPKMSVLRKEFDEALDAEDGDDLQPS